MAAVPLTPEQHRRLVRLIAERAGILTPLNRETLLDEVGLTAFRTRLNFDTDARTFASQLVRVLQDHGTLADTGQPALVSLLRVLREIVAGHEDDAAFVDALLAPVTSQRAAELAFIQQRLAAIPQETIRSDDFTNLAGHGELRARRPALRSRLILRPELRDLHRIAEERLAALERETQSYDSILDAIPQVRQAVLLGEPGSGKTTTLHVLEQVALDQALTDPDAPIPLFLPLGEWTSPDEPLADFLARVLGPLAPWLDALRRAGRAMVLADGLDQLPPTQRAHKGEALRDLIATLGTGVAVLSCREQDYTLELGLDRLVLAPLDPLRIHDFVTRYLGAGEGERLFWHLAGTPLRETWAVWQAAGATFTQFWQAEVIPREQPNVYRQTTHAQDELWRQRHDPPGGLLGLARTPYLLVMLVAVFDATGELPANRAALFAEFVETLLVREELGTRDPHTDQVEITAEGEVLRTALTTLAYAMQQRRGTGGEAGDAVTTLPEDEVVPTYLTAPLLRLAVRCNLLLVGEVVRFSHQLLQEYLAATQMRTEIKAGRLHARDIWPSATWWARTGWEEATVLLAGLDSELALHWSADANPEVAAECLQRSGAGVPEMLEALRNRWLARVTDVQGEPDPRGRAAVGRALALAGLDNRRGVGLRADGLPDIAWVTLPGVRFSIGGDENAYQSLRAQEVELPTFWLAKYPVTNAQWQAFLADPAGYHDPEERWWQGLAGGKQTPAVPSWDYGNHPRETVNWYEAVAFCRWLGAQLDYTVVLPSQTQWERAARGTAGRVYPWGDKWDQKKANTGEGGIEQTSAVGLYPQGATPEGICDLAGNVWEWTSTASDTGDDIMTTSAPRVLRGGSWHSLPRSARATSRFWRSPVNRDGNYGFRLVALAPALQTLER